jgi:hypothetical protein
VKRSLSEVTESGFDEVKTPVLSKGVGFFVFRIVVGKSSTFLALCNAEKMSGQTTQLRGINTQYESIG